MIGSLLRVLPVAARASMRRDGARISQIHRRVRPREIDINLHMNQAVYATIFELGRTDWAIRSGAWRTCREAGLTPMVADQTLIYRKELRTFQRYTVDTRAVALEGRLLVVEGHVLVGDRVHTVGRARLLFVGPNGVLKADEVERHCSGWLVEALPVEDWQVRREGAGSPR